MQPITRVVFVGSKQLGVRCLATLHRLAPSALVGVVTIDDRADKRNAYVAIEEFCQRHGIPLHVAANQRTSESLIASLEPDLCFVGGWYWLISREALARVPGGFIGIHYSLLPKYRGGSPLVWALINGEPEVGLSIFSFTPGMDDGDLWAQATISVEPEDTIASVLARLQPLAIATLEAKYLDILAGRIKPVPQRLEGSTFCAQRLPTDGEISWHMPARDVHNFIRAQSDPYPGAFTWLSGEKLVAWAAQLTDTVYYGRPGQVARVTPEGILVVCGDHHPVLVKTVGWQGTRKSASDVVRSVQTRLGTETSR